MSPGYRHCYCAFCKSKRRVYTKKHITVLDVLYCFVLGFSFGLVVWQEINAKFIPIAITFMGLAEVITQIRRRLSLVCRKCGFDPLLYLKSPKLAAERVRTVFESRLKNPNILDKRLPVLENRKVASKSPAVKSSEV